VAIFAQHASVSSQPAPIQRESLLAVPELPELELPLPNLSHKIKFL